jgi:hypothetical protein
MSKLQKLDLSLCKHLSEIIGTGFDNLLSLDITNLKQKQLRLIKMEKLKHLYLSNCFNL